MKVSEIMTRDVQVANPEHSIQAVAGLMADKEIGFLVVGENDQLVGTITDRDIVVRGIANHKNGDAQVRDVMTPDVKYCFEDEEVEDIAENMGDIQVRRMPVVDRNKRLVGVVSLGDVARKDGPDSAGVGISGIARPGGSQHQ